ncbi:MAG: hypothetical protein K5868_02515 [Lachnospiraceae bacterium]|nr:hypothetical protein [Lachnospiraceae bacterium]
MLKKRVEISYLFVLTFKTVTGIDAKTINREIHIPTLRSTKPSKYVSKTEPKIEVGIAFSKDRLRLALTKSTSPSINSNGIVN